MGDDSAIVQAARVSYGDGTKTVLEDKALIRYLLRHKHTSPFEMTEIKLHIKLPIFIARQWIRHRTASVNEYSGRYSEMKDEFYVPDLEQITPQSKINKQGRGEDVFTEEFKNSVVTNMGTSQKESYEEYKEYLDSGVAREVARINLPLSNYTEWYWKMDLHNLFHFLRLRMDSHAQYEIRVYAEAIGQIVKELFPIAWEAFEDYVLNGVYFSAEEHRIIKSLLLGHTEAIVREIDASEKLSSREKSEFKGKLV